MAAYVANHRYSDRIDYERFDFVAGQVVDLSAAVAERINRNSPGVLSPVDPDADPAAPAPVAATAEEAPAEPDNAPDGPVEAESGPGNADGGPDSGQSEQPAAAPRRGRPRKAN